MAKKVRIIKQIKPRMVEIPEEKEEVKIEKITITRKKEPERVEPFEEEVSPATERRAPVIVNEESVESLERRAENIPSDVGDKETAREFSYVTRNVTTDDTRARTYGPAENAVVAQERANVLRNEDSLLREQRIFRDEIIDNKPIRNESVTERNYETPQEKRRKRMPWE